MTRDQFLQQVEAKLGLPYLWDGKGRIGPCDWNGIRGASEPYTGRDCSGCVTSSIHDAGGPDWRSSHNAQLLFDRLPHTDEPKPGTLCFYGPDAAHINHVMVYAGDDGDRAGQVLGACGGGHSTTTLAAAELAHAKVQYRASVHYRGDFVGFADPPVINP